MTVPRADLKKGYPPANLNGLPLQWQDRNHTYTWMSLYARQKQTVKVPPLVARD